MPRIDSKGNLVNKPPGVLEGYSLPAFFGIFGSILTFIVAFIQALFTPLIGNGTSSTFFKRGGNGSGPSGGGGGNGGGGGGNRPIGRLNDSSMDMSSCPTGGCGCG